MLHYNEFFIKMYTHMETKQGLFKANANYLFFLNINLVNWLYT